jgi:HTH-type transcriptional regulator, sugar sensing transcriptional regulator
MDSVYRAKLEQLGLSQAEAEIYLAVLRQGPLAAAAIAQETGIARTSIYPNLCTLAEKGLVEGGAGYGSKFAAVAPAQALAALVAREKQTIVEREQIADELAEVLAPLAAADSESALDDTVQILRTPHLISERFDRLQLESERQIEAFVKAPILSPRLSNPPQKKAQQRGVQIRALYERAVLDDEKVKPYLEAWVAGGEEARVFGGELPYKLVIFDRAVVLLTLVRRNGQSSAMLVRHEPFVKSLGILFDYFWQQAEVLVPRSRKVARAISDEQRNRRTTKIGSSSRNGGRNVERKRNGW